MWKYWTQKIWTEKWYFFPIALIMSWNSFFFFATKKESRFNFLIISLIFFETPVFRYLAGWQISSIELWTVSAHIENNNRVYSFDIGKWKKVKRTAIHAKLVQNWDENKFYYKGDKVTFNGCIYQVTTDTCIAIPDCKVHKWFYCVCNSPFQTLSILVTLIFICIILFGLITYRETKWYNVAANIVFIILNFHVVYILARDWILLYVKRKVDMKLN